MGEEYSMSNFDEENPCLSSEASNKFLNKRSPSQLLKQNLILNKLLLEALQALASYFRIYSSETNPPAYAIDSLIRNLEKISDRCFFYQEGHQ